MRHRGSVSPCHPERERGAWRGGSARHRASRPLAHARGDIHSIVVNLGIIGGGRAAWAFGSTWRRLGWPIAGVTLRDGSPSPIASLLGTRSMPLDELAKESELILIAVSDAAIADFAQRIPPTNAVTFHCS